MTTGFPVVGAWLGVFLLAGLPVRADEDACLRCHAVSDSVASAPQLIPAVLQQSAHRRLDCLTCHPEARATPHQAVSSRPRQAALCGKCHPSEYREYSLSVHAQAVRQGVNEAPTCASCHGEHGMRPPAEVPSRVSAQNIVATCADCHDDPLVIARTNLPADVVETYDVGCHGVLGKYGMRVTADCASCHGQHAILPSWDPRSPTNRRNLPQTCGKCHQQTPKVVSRKIHGPNVPARQGGWWNRARLFYPLANRSLNPVVLAGLGGLLGVLSGTLGIGGGFLLTPLLIFLGVPGGFAATTSTAEITAAGVSGALGHARQGNVDLRLGLLTTVGALAGGSAGVCATHRLGAGGTLDLVLRGVYVVLLGGVALSMLAGSISGEQTGANTGRSKAFSLAAVRARLDRIPFRTRFPVSHTRMSVFVPLLLGGGIGTLAALGAGGGFLLVPALIILLGVPTRIAVGTGLLQVTLTCIVITIEQAVMNHSLDLLLALTLFPGAIFGAQLGVRMNHWLKETHLRLLLGLLALGVLIGLLHGVLVPPQNAVTFAGSVRTP